MITIVYSTHKDEIYNNKFKEHLTSTVGLPDVQILQYINKNEFSLSQGYNKGINDSIFDIIVCVHNDIKLEKGWGKKILEDFHKNPDYAIIGKAGSSYMPETGVYWEKMNQTMVGQVYHEPEGQKKWLSKYSPNFPFLIPVVTIDGLFISFDKTKIKHKFDEDLPGFHFYDHGFCIPNFLDGVKIGVTSSFEIIHKSVGRPNDEFYLTKAKFIEKYKTHLPIDLKPSSPYVEKITEKPIKNIGKVAIIIPNKSNNSLLFDCISSFYEHCNKNLFHIFIADTGSDSTEIDGIKTFVSDYDNISLIEYDYYNFAKINNDVVKNYVNNDFEFLLFCNNDIKLLNNVIYGMLKTFKTNPKIGTVGARLHFGDGTIQHDGIILLYKQNRGFDVTHKSLRSYYNYLTNSNFVIGSTAALLMIRKKVFESCGYFNESYQSCFEDVELNLKCIIKGYNNICDSQLVAFHYESQTRNLDENKMNKVIEDSRLLMPFIGENVLKFKKYIKEI
jgi:GT2 family glycosyltransferase